MFIELAIAFLILAVIAFVAGVIASNLGWEPVSKVWAVTTIVCSGLTACFALIGFLVWVLKIFGVTG